MPESKNSSPATAKPRTRKSARKSRVETPAAVVANPGASTGNATTGIVFDLGIQRDAMVAEAAYFRAVNRRFAPGHELEDWLSAEREIDALLSQPTQARQ